MPIDRSHQHVSSDVMDADAIHTPINPNGGGLPADWEVSGPHKIIVGSPDTNLDIQDGIVDIEAAFEGDYRSSLQLTTGPSARLEAEQGLLNSYVYVDLEEVELRLAGVDEAQVLLNADGAKIGAGGGTRFIQIHPDHIEITGGPAGITLEDDGIHLQANNPVSFEGNDAVDFGAVVTMPSLPTADPAVAGQLWNDTGTLKISAG